VNAAARVAGGSAYETVQADSYNIIEERTDRDTSLVQRKAGRVGRQHLERAQELNNRILL
jgi:hypothetical protein